MIFVGIDQSLNNTGMTILREGGQTPSHFSIIPEKGMTGVHRTSFVSERIKNLLTEETRGEDHIIVCREGYSYGSKSSSVFNLGEMGGCIDMKIFESINQHFSGTFIYYNLPPNSWKLLVLGAGNIKKDTKYLLTAYERTGIMFTDDNIADSHMITLAIKKIYDFDFGSLTIKEKMGMISSSVRKKAKITERSIGKLTEDKFKEHLCQTLEEYTIFKQTINLPEI